MPFAAESVHAADAGSAAAVSHATQDMNYALVQLNGEPLATYVKTKPPAGKKIDFTRRHQVLPGPALRAAQRLQGLAARQRAEGQGHRRVRHLAQRRLGQAQRRDAGAGGRPRRWSRRRSTRASTTRIADRSRPGAHQRHRGLGAAGGAANAGAGVKVAIVDSGIDVSHPCFTDAGYPAQTQLGDPQLHQQQGHRRQGLQQQDARAALHAEAIDTHGTHVAGTVACNFETPAVVDGVTHPLRDLGRRAARAARQLQRLPGHGRATPAPRTSSTPSRPPTSTASTSPT